MELQESFKKMIGCLDPAQRKLRKSDFHIPANETPEEALAERVLWIEADFEFPELAVKKGAKATMPAVPGGFAHMQLVTDAGPARVRFRLKASLDQDDDIEESFTYVTAVDPNGAPTAEGRVSKQDRNAIQVHYLPARRDPSDHISYSTNALLGRALRSTNWTKERDEIKTLAQNVSDTLGANLGVEGIVGALSVAWNALHKGKYYADPSITFGRSEIDNLLKHMSICFTPGHSEPTVDYTRLSDGQQSLLYLSLVLSMHEIGSKVLSGELAEAFDIDKMRPAVFTFIAVEEPENSLSPHYLGRIINALTAFSIGQDAQAIVATHSPSLLRRVPPEAIRYLRLSQSRNTVVKTITLPDDDDAEKYVREGLQAFPELYFSRFVILGEGDSEEIVLPRLLAARGILADDASISVVPLGGRHVNHFWRLLHSLGIPHVTLLDLDLARFQGGWGRIKYAAKQLLAYSDTVSSILTPEHIAGIPKWNDDRGLMVDDLKWIGWLESQNVFFSSPLDLDFMMIQAYPDAYGISGEDLEPPDEDTLKAVLGKAHDTVGGQYTDDQLEYFDEYYGSFMLGSKPACHIRALSNIDDEDLLSELPDVLDRLFKRSEEILKGLPE
jgi:putative ATP-dependent endonuclease of OLD family